MRAAILPAAAPMRSYDIAWAARKLWFRTGVSSVLIAGTPIRCAVAAITGRLVCSRFDWMMKSTSTLSFRDCSRCAMSFGLSMPTSTTSRPAFAAAVRISAMLVLSLSSPGLKGTPIRLAFGSSCFTNASEGL